MKLQTAIPARRDGTLNVQGADGKTYAFQADEAGVLTGEVDHDGTAAHLLASGNFWPANHEDMDAALRLTGEGESQDEDEDQDEDEGEDKQPDGGAPVEANTPLKPAPDMKAGGRPRKAR